MDRNTILAIALSMLVLTGYQMFFVLPKNLKDQKSTQVIENKEITEKITNNPSEKLKDLIPTTHSKIKTEIVNIQTTDIKTEFSNMGGVLHSIGFTNSEKALPIVNILSVHGFEDVPYKIVSKDDQSVEFAYISTELKIVKRFTITDKNSLKATIQITRLKESSRLEPIKFNLLDVDGVQIDPQNDKSSMLIEYSVLQDNHVTRKGSAFKFSPKDNMMNSVPVEWVGFRDHYHAFLIKPEFKTKTYETNMVSEKYWKVSVTPDQTLTSYDFTIVGGDQNIGLLKKYNPTFGKIVAFFNWGWVDIFAKGIYYLIPIAHTIGFGSWGMAIILVSLFIYGLTYPLTIKSMASMKKMQQVQPKVAALQKKHKGDPQKLNAEMVDLYKREGVNPLGGCLPFLLQMPIFVALYQVLWRSYYFQGKSFLWIKDLALPDRLFYLPFSLPFLGNEFNILPIVMAGVMFLQQSLSAKNMVVTDESQAMQQKMMKYIFPVFIGFIFYHFASGLSLYFTVFYALSTWTQWKVSQSTVVVKK